MRPCRHIPAGLVQPWLNAPAQYGSNFCFRSNLVNCLWGESLSGGAWRMSLPQLRQPIPCHVMCKQNFALWNWMSSMGFSTQIFSSISPTQSLVFFEFHEDHSEEWSHVTHPPPRWQSDVESGFIIQLNLYFCFRPMAAILKLRVQRIFKGRRCSWTRAAAHTSKQERVVRIFKWTRCTVLMLHNWQTSCLLNARQERNI